MKESHLFSDDKSKVFEAVLKLGVPYSGTRKVRFDEKKKKTRARKRGSRGGFIVAVPMRPRTAVSRYPSLRIALISF